MKMLIRAALALLALFACAPAMADVVTLPQVRNAGGANVPSVAAVIIDASGNPVAGGAASSVPVAGTVAVANTFQSVLAASVSRKGCLIQNTSASALLAFLGAPGSATAASSIVIPPGGSLSCNAPGLVISDQISLTSAAAGASYVVVSQ